MSVRLGLVLSTTCVVVGCVGADPAPAPLEVAIDADDLVMVGNATTVQLTVVKGEGVDATAATLRFGEDAGRPTLRPWSESCSVADVVMTCALGAARLQTFLVDATWPSTDTGDTYVAAQVRAGERVASAEKELSVVRGVETTIRDSVDPAQTGFPVDYLVDLGPWDRAYRDATLVLSIDESAGGVPAIISTAHDECVVARTPGTSSGATCAVGDLEGDQPRHYRFTVVWERMPRTLNPHPVRAYVLPAAGQRGRIGQALETTAIQPATLSMTVTDAPDPIAEGDPVTYTIELFNDSAQELPATSLVLHFQAPFIGSEVMVRTPGCTATSPYDVACPVAALAAHARRQVAVEVLFPTVTTLILADVRLVLDDLVLAERRSIDTRVVHAATDLAVAATGAPSPVSAGGPVALAASVTNLGDRDAADVVLTVALPPALRLVAASTACAEAAGTLTCELGDLASGGQRVVSILATALAAGAAATTFAIDSAAVDPYPLNDTATVTTTVTTPTCDLGVVLVDGGDPVSYTFGPSYGATVTNHGPDAATGVVVEVQTPAGYNVSILGQVGCTLAPGLVTCDVGALAAGASATISFSGYGTPNSLASATATVHGDQPDPVPANDSDTETTQVTP